MFDIDTYLMCITFFYLFSTFVLEKVYFILNIKNWHMYIKFHIAVKKKTYYAKQQHNITKFNVL